MSAGKELNYYYNFLHKSVECFACPRCGTPTVPKRFERHCSSRHDLNPKTACVWCGRVSWPSGQKRLHAGHLLDCFRKFVSYEAVGQMTWTPRKRDREILNYYKPLSDRADLLESEIENLKKRDESRRSEIENLKETVESQRSEIENLKAKLNRQSDQCKNKVNTLNCNNYFQ